MLPPLPRRSVWAYCFAHFTQPCQPSPKGSSGRPAHRLFEVCSAFTHVAACTLARSPIRGPLSEGFSHFVTSMTAPVASGWSGCRVGLTPTGKRRFCHGAHPVQTFRRLLLICGIPPESPCMVLGYSLAASHQQSSLRPTTL